MYAIPVPSSKLIVLNPVIMALISRVRQAFGAAWLRRRKDVLWGEPRLRVDVRCRMFPATTPPDVR
jgi:hypothetical protein